MIVSLLAAAVQETVPYTPNWSPSVGIVMSLFTVVGVLLGYKFGGQHAEGEAPLPAKIIGGAALGHILGVGVVLGLANTGVF